MSNQNVAYLRVSSVDQSLARQQEAMKDIKQNKVFEETLCCPVCGEDFPMRLRTVLLLAVFTENHKIEHQQASKPVCFTHKPRLAKRNLSLLVKH